MLIPLQIIPNEVIDAYNFTELVNDLSFLKNKSQNIKR